MPKPWTTKEQNECSLVYSTVGMQAAIELTGRSNIAVKRKMFNLGVRCISISIPPEKPRKFYAEDVAMMFEMFSSGVKQKTISEYFNTTLSSIKSVFSDARKKGFDAYPKRPV